MAEATHRRRFFTPAFDFTRAFSTQLLSLSPLLPAIISLLITISIYRREAIYLALPRKNTASPTSRPLITPAIFDTSAAVLIERQQRRAYIYTRALSAVIEYADADASRERRLRASLPSRHNL